MAVLLEKSSDEVEVNDDFDANLLRGTTEQTAVSSIVGGTVYVLYNGEFVKTCPNCKTIFMFNSLDIYRDDMSFSVFCPNCDH